jgi:hypothetical protein
MKSLLLAAVSGNATCAGSDGEIGYLATASVVAPLTATQNLIPNPSLENANAAQPPGPVGWKSGSWGNNSAAFSYISDAHSGLRSARIDLTTYTSGDAKWTFDWVPADGRAAYVYTDYYKSSASSDAYEGSKLAFGPYTQMEPVRPGAQVLDCKLWGLFFCERAGQVSEVLAGEVVAQDPWGSPARGRYALLKLKQKQAAQSKVLHIRCLRTECETCRKA